MIAVSKTTAGVPTVHASGAVVAGTIYIAEVTTDGATHQPVATPQLAKGQQVVLIMPEGGRLELTATQNISVIPNVTGTYLAQSDYAKCADWGDAKVRLYGWSDTWRKISSGAGVLVLLSTIAPLLTAVVGVFFLIATQPSPSAATVADRAQTLFAWVRQPADALPLATTGSPAAADRQQLEIRVDDASLCLQAIQGHDAPPTSVPGISCAAASTAPWWRTTLTGALITSGIGALTALLALLNLPRRFGFQRSP